MTSRGKYMPPSMRDTLVNTSLPAKEAPRLAPATLASITTATSATSATSVTSAVTGIASRFSTMHLKPLSKVHLTDDDFPTLGAKPVKAPTVPVAQVAQTNFAALSREWAKKQEEDALVAKEAAEKERNHIQVLQSIRQKEAKEAEEFRMRTILLPVKRNQKEQQVLDIGGNESDGSVAESYDSPPEIDYEEEEEEEEEEMNSHWDGRRYRNEL